MLDNRSATLSNSNCSCQSRACVNKILAVLAIALALVVGGILGAQFVTTVIEAIIPLAIFAIGLLLAIILIYFFARCKCRLDD